MDIRIGTPVIDRNGAVIGPVKHVVRDTWTGDLHKFMVKTEKVRSGIPVSPDAVEDVREDAIVLKVSADELPEE